MFPRSTGKVSASRTRHQPARLPRSREVLRWRPFGERTCRCREVAVFRHKPYDVAIRVRLVGLLCTALPSPVRKDSLSRRRVVLDLSRTSSGGGRVADRSLEMGLAVVGRVAAAERGCARKSALELSLVRAFHLGGCLVEWPAVKDQKQIRFRANCC